MGKILRLDSTLVSKIAAGEVIERPASCLKELLDNAIDSGAKAIKVSIEDGGKKMISVSDDGCGIAPEDLPLAFERHATSKIRTFEDMLAAMTLGFRGEALASCSAVARVRILTSTDDSGAGHEMSCHEGSLGELAPAARSKGTTVEVRDLFHFVPARKNYLKSEATEAKACRTAFIRSAMSHPEIRFTFIKDKKQVFNFAPKPISERWKEIIGLSVNDAAAAVELSVGEYSVTGFASLVAKEPAAGQMTFVNGRFVYDKIFQHACKEALRSASGGALDGGSYVLFLNLPAKDVDVNVHPEKISVRFRQAQVVHQLIFTALRHSFERLKPARSEVHGNEPRGEAPPLGSRSYAPSDDSAELDFSGTTTTPGGDRRSGAFEIGKTRSGGLLVEQDGQILLIGKTHRRAYALAKWLNRAIDDGSLIGAPLLIPVEVPCDPTSIQTFSRFRKQIESFGISFSFSNDQRALLIQSAPPQISGIDFLSFFQSIAGDLAQRGARQGRICTFAGLASVSTVDLCWDDEYDIGAGIPPNDLWVMPFSKARMEASDE